MERYRIAEDGFELVAGLVSADEQLALLHAVGNVDAAGRRNMLAIGAVAKLAGSRQLLKLVRPHTGGAPRPVRAIWFNKSPETNWLVAWHQDLAIAVRERIETPGFSGWSVKDGVPHVQPPAEILERMLTLRIHLDDADGENGALRVIAGTHGMGRLDAERIAQLREERGRDAVRRGGRRCAADAAVIAACFGAFDKRVAAAGVAY